MRLRRWVLPVVMLLSTASLAACSSSEPASSEAQVAPPGDDWVVVVFDDTDLEFDLGIMDALLETELAADDALTEAGLGMIDGNEIGDHSYELYFVGGDGEAMWRVLEPVFEDAPVPWTRVAIRSGFEDDAPRVITR
ncbi:hypothetical protein ACUOFU_00660 [Microbacterium arabinogalactanolyticum]|uniref:hypothetical protein n=1 Tax=Microbacterium arabinogalactanolyticum TaxID=69365 RepID=UPI0040446544